MTINSLNARRRHWDNPKNRAPYAEHDLTDSLPYPWEEYDAGYETLFTGKDVLEIGPGRGRQYERVRQLQVRSYSICDISGAALLEPIFKDIPITAKFQVEDYSNDLGRRFEVIHFWYVLHHVQVDELGDFFNFVARHLCNGGMCLFNSPQSHNAREWYTANGLGTTWMDTEAVTEAYTPYLTTVSIHHQDERSSGALFVVRKPISEVK